MLFNRVEVIVQQGYKIIMHRAAVLNSQISEDLSQPSDPDNDSQQSVEQRFIPKVDRNLNYEPNFSHIVINLAFTNYPVVKQVAKSLGMWSVEDKEETDWDVCWTDHPIGPDTFIRMHFHQTVNYLPGIHTIARKNELGNRLNAMQAAVPKQYSFHPQTWMLPDDFSQLRRHMQGPGRRCIYIVKPEAACQGRGIYLVNRLDDIAIGQHCVVQKYIDNPLLIDSYKFDLRVYVLIGSIEPLRIYLYHDGLARFATEAYTGASRQNFKSSYQHLTNYAINKFNPKFKAALSSGEEEGGFKRSLKAAFKTLADNGVDTDKLWLKIEQIAVKTVILGYEKIKKNYISCQPQEYHNHMAFHILGLDIFIDDQCQPYLLEVNHTPSFATETYLDTRIKTALIKDTLVLMRSQDLALKHELFTKSKTYSSNRIENGIRQAYQEQSRATLLQQQLKKRLEYESVYSGGYNVIYPSEDDEKNKNYADLIAKAKQVLDPKRAARKNSMLTQGEIQRIRQKHKQRDQETERDRLKDKIKEVDKAHFKKKISDLKTKHQDASSSRAFPQEHQIRKTITTFGRKQSTIATDQLNHISLLTNFQHNNSVVKQNRAFTIKTKSSIPEVSLKPPVRPVEAGPFPMKKQTNKFRIQMISNSKGAFIKPKIYDVPSLLITNYVPEEQKIIRRKNREGKLIFHLSKT